MPHALSYCSLIMKTEAYMPLKHRSISTSLCSVIFQNYSQFPSFPMKKTATRLYLESVHLPAPDTVIHSASKNVHGIPYDSWGMTQPSWRNLRTITWSHNRPCLCVKVIAVQVIWQSAIGCSSKYIEVAIKCHQGVAISACRRGWCTTQDVFRWYSCPAD
jgi:hypothetical protein